MKIRFYAPRWGFEGISWNSFAGNIAQNGFSGIEAYPLQSLHEKADLLKALDDNGLELALIHSEMKEGRDFNAYKNALIKNLYTLADYQTSSLKPQFINSHTGREYYSRDQMAECFAICDDISRETGISIIHETHRNKWAYAAHVTHVYLKEFEDVRLALDISHWVCVSESYLQDQDEAVELAIQHADHLHARVGHLEGPQITDPRAPENSEALKYHLAWWDRWITAQKDKGLASCTITPEFGPHPYMSYQINTNQPVTSQWDINLYIKQLLTDRYQNLII